VKIFLVVLVTFLVFFWVSVFIIFNVVINIKNHLIESEKNIDIFLKKRFDLIKNLEEVVKGITKHEKNLHENIANLRSSIELMDPKDIKNQNKITESLKSTFALFENYPEIKSNQNFLSFQKELVEIENQIERSRRFFNAYVRKFNTTIEVFPINVISKFFGFKKRDFLEFEVDSMRDVNVKFEK